MMNEQKYTITCSHCKSVLDSKQVELESKTIIMVPNGEQLKLTYWNCPACGKEFHIILCDKVTERLASRYESQVQYLKAIYGHGSNPKKSDVNKMLRLKQELKHKYDDLNVRYKNSVYQFEGKEYKLELSVPDHILDGGK